MYGGGRNSFSLARIFNRNVKYAKTCSEICTWALRRNQTTILLFWKKKKKPRHEGSSAVLYLPLRDLVDENSCYNALQHCTGFLIELAITPDITVSHHLNPLTVTAWRTKPPALLITREPKVPVIPKGRFAFGKGRGIVKAAAVLCTLITGGVSWLTPNAF